jgi:hypothetical protein
MSAKTSAARREAFLAALRETGNRTIAAERARVSQSWVTLHRGADPAFKAAMVAAVAEAKARLGGAAAMRPAAGWGSLEGEELVMRGGNGRRVQVARARLRQWTPRAEARFLTTLAATCNVKASCAEVGLSVPSAYNHRKRWQAFADRWDEAVEIGYARLEFALLEHACNMFSAPEVMPDAPMPPMRVDEAMQLLYMHRHQVHGIGGRPGLVAMPPTFEEVRPGILRKVEAIKRAETLDAADREAYGRPRPAGFRPGK